VSGLIQIPDGVDMIRTYGDWIAYQEGGAITRALSERSAIPASGQSESKWQRYQLDHAEVPIITSHPVQENDGVSKVSEHVIPVTEMMSNKCIFIEMGAGGVMSNMMKQLLGEHALFTHIFGQSPDEEGDMANVYRALGDVWAYGMDVDWNALHANDNRRRIPLPTYVFDSISHESDVIAVQSGTHHKKDTMEEDVFSESHTDPAPSRYDSHIE